MLPLPAVTRHLLTVPIAFSPGTHEFFAA
jgi:hypothetical protein